MSPPPSRADQWSSLSSAEVIDKMAENVGSEPVGRYLGLAEMMRRLSSSLDLHREEMGQAGRRLERRTDVLVRLTWALLLVGGATLALTCVLVWIEVT